MRYIVLTNLKRFLLSIDLEIRFKIRIIIRLRTITKNSTTIIILIFLNYIL